MHLRGLLRTPSSAGRKDAAPSRYRSASSALRIFSWSLGSASICPALSSSAVGRADLLLAGGQLFEQWYLSYALCTSRRRRSRQLELCARQT